MLASKSPRSFISGANVDLSVTLKQSSTKEFHHIFPDKYLQRLGKNRKEIYPLANFCFLNNADNQKIKDKAPSEYVQLMNTNSVPEILSAAICPENTFATVYKGNIIKNLIMDCQSYTKYRPNETTGGIFVSWRRKEELPTGA